MSDHENDSDHEDLSDNVDESETGHDIDRDLVKDNGQCFCGFRVSMLMLPCW